MRALITQVEPLVAKNGSAYIRFHYSQSSNGGEKNSVMFDNGGGVPATDDILGKVCDIALTTQANGQTRATAITPTTDDPSPYVRRSQVQWETVIQFIKPLFSPDDPVGKMCLTILANEKLIERFSRWPAAKEVHHGFYGGLAEHTYAMLRLAKFVMEEDPAHLELDKGVVFGAILMHDIGKILELDFAPGGSPQRSMVGLLIGHISLADEIICKTCNNLGIPTREGRILNLRHCVLSHHGKKDWGSPIIPATAEAGLIHQVDMLQSRGQMFREGLADVPVGSTGDYHKQLGTEVVKL